MYQATIGPRSFGEGLLSLHWRVAQQRHYVNEASKEKSKRWVSKLIQKIWEVSWGMWEFRNNDIHTNAETRRDIYAKGIFKEIEAVKIRARFSMLLNPKERKFINTSTEDLKRKSERGQLDWICRAEQFVCTIRLSKRLRQSTGQYFELHARTLTRNVQQSIRRYATSNTSEGEVEQRIIATSNDTRSSKSHAAIRPKTP